MDTKKLLPEWKDWNLNIVRVPDEIVPPSLVAEGVEMYMMAGSSLPYGNSKALTVLGLLLGAEERGSLKGKHTLVEGTSGNTGKVLSAMAPLFGIKNVVLVMEPDVPYAKRFPGIAHGAKILPPEDGLTTIQTARGWGTRDGWLNLDQYANADSLRLHSRFAAPKLVETLGEPPTLFVASIGTSGTIGGMSEHLRKHGTSILGVLLEDDYEIPGMRDEPGMSGVRLPWRTYVDAIEKIETRESYYASLCLIRTTGFSFGPSSGSTYIGALKGLLRRQKEGTLDSIRNKKGKIIVAMLGPDGYEAYNDRFDAQMHRNHSKSGALPLPWEVLSRRHRSFEI